MNSRNRVGTSRGELTVQEAEETAKSKRLPVTGRIGLNNPTGNGADLLMVFYGKEGRQPMNVQHSTTSHDEKRTDKDLATQWNSIHWKDVKVHVNRMQTRIAKAVVERKWHLVNTEALSSQT
jgi:RNA-directed DNA polymerase